MKLVLFLVLSVCLTGHWTDARGHRGGQRYQHRLEMRLKKRITKMCSRVQVLNKIETPDLPDVTVPASTMTMPPTHMPHTTDIPPFETSADTPVPSSSAFPVPSSSAFPVPSSSAFPVPSSSAFPVPSSSAFPVPPSSAFPVKRRLGKDEAIELLDLGLKNILVDVCKKMMESGELEFGPNPEEMLESRLVDKLRHSIVRNAVRACRTTQYLEEFENVPYLQHLDKACRFLSRAEDNEYVTTAAAFPFPTSYTSLPASSSPPFFRAIPAKLDVVRKLVKVCREVLVVDKNGAMTLFHKYLPNKPALFIEIMKGFLTYCKKLVGAVNVQ